MRLIGLMKVRNERWCLRASLPAALRVVDEMVILDHASTDETPAIIAEAAGAFPGRVHTLTHADGEWREAAILQRLLEEGRARGGTHFYSIDADEILSGNLLHIMRDATNALSPGHAISLPLPNLWRSLDEFRDDNSVWAQQYVPVVFADGPGVSFTPKDGSYDIHTRIPRGVERLQHRLIPDAQYGGLMHLQFANRRRLVAKHAWYKMIEVVRWPGRRPAAEIDAYYNRALDERGMGLSPAPLEWWAPYADLKPLIDTSDEPWHEAACREMWEAHGAAFFKGLELWGVPEGPRAPEVGASGSKRDTPGRGIAHAA